MTDLTLLGAVVAAATGSGIVAWAVFAPPRERRETPPEWGSVVDWEERGWA